MRARSIIVCLILISSCASYVTPGGAARLDEISSADIAEVASRKPSPDFPARLAIARVQDANYQSYSTQAYVTGRFSVVTTQELMSEGQMMQLSEWPEVAGIAPIGRLLLPPNPQSLDDRRTAAAKVQADILLVHTIDTSFRVLGRGYGPLSVVSLGLVPDRDAYVTSTASALFMDVRTGFVYGLAESTAKAMGLTNAWGSGDTVDRKRLEAEKEAFML